MSKIRDAKAWVWAERTSARIHVWVERVLGLPLLERRERAARLLEEVVELCQAENVEADLVGRIVERVYSRDPGVPAQELAGVTLCVLAYARSTGVDIIEAAELELDRIEMLDPDIVRAKHAAKASANTAMSGILPIRKA